MIIRNNFDKNNNGFGHKRRIDSNNNNYLDEEKEFLKKSIDNLDKRYKNGEVSHEQFKRIAGNYALEHKNLNERINKHH